MAVLGITVPFVFDTNHALISVSGDFKSVLKPSDAANPMTVVIKAGRLTVHDLSGKLFQSRTDILFDFQV
jgi:hypothetical protein